MNSNIRLIHSTEPKPEKIDETSSVDLDLFLMPDADFDQRIIEENTKPANPGISFQSGSDFSDIVLAPEFSLDKIDLPQEIQQESKPPVINQRQKAQTGTFPTLNLNLLDDGTEPIENEKKSSIKKVQVISNLENESEFFSQRIQEVLGFYKTDTLKNSIKRYAKILLYFLEQFHINGTKEQNLSFIIELKEDIIKDEIIIALNDFLIWFQENKSEDDFKTKINNFLEQYLKNNKENKQLMIQLLKVIYEMKLKKPEEIQKNKSEIIKKTKENFLVLYKGDILKKGYRVLNGGLKEDLDFLFEMYKKCYQESKKEFLEIESEILKKQIYQNNVERVKLLKKIADLEEELLGDEDLSAFYEVQELENKMKLENNGNNEIQDLDALDEQLQRQNDLVEIERQVEARMQKNAQRRREREERQQKN